MSRPPPKLDWEINILTEFWAVPCGVPLIVYFETLFHATYNMIFTLLSFGLEDVVRGYFRPQRLRSWRHGRKGRPGRFKKQFIPETGEIVAKWIPGIEEVKGRWVDDGVRWLWELDEKFQQVLYYIMIFGIVDDFWTDLNSGIIMSEKAHCENVARLMRKGRPQITGPQGWVAMDLDELIYSEHIDIQDTFGCQVGAGQFMAIFSANIKNKSALPLELTCGCRIRVERNGEEIIDNGSVITISRDHFHSSIASLKFNGPASVNWEGLVVGGEADFQNAQCNVFQIGNPQH